MSPETKLLIYAVSAPVTGWSLFQAITRGKIEGEDSTYTVLRTPIRFCAAFILQCFALAFCAGELLYGAGLCGDPAEGLEHLVAFFLSPSATR